MNFFELGKKIKSYREIRGLTQADLANMVGLTVQYICYIETGKKKPSLEMVAKIAKSLKTEIKDLLG